MQPSLNELQELLSSRYQEVDDIKADLQKANELITSCNERLNNLIGQPAAKAPQKSLRMFIKDILGNTNEPLTVKEISELVLEAGYKTNATTNFRSMVQQAILKDAEFKRRTKPKTRPARYGLED